MIAMMIKPLLGGMAAAMLTILLAVQLPDPKALVLLAVLLGFVAGVYLGFGFADGRAWEGSVELAVAVVFLGVAALGLWASPLLLAAGFVAHAVWGLLHHPRRIRTLVSGWFPPLCSVYEVLIAAYIIYRWV
ncbi:MAG: DUF6010 family protein [Acidobacteriota bacterium]